MNLNANILYEELSRELNTERSGFFSNELDLGLPEIYLDNKITFQKNHVYIARSDKLPVTPDISGSSLIICFGGRPSNRYFGNAFSLIIVHSATDILLLFNQVQAIYSKYQAWSDALGQIIETTADIQAMITASFSIFDNFLAIIDDQMNYIAYTRDLPSKECRDLFPDSDGKVPMVLFKALTKKQKNEEQMETNCFMATEAYSTELFQDRILIGIFVIFPLHHVLTSGEHLLATYLADRVLLAMSRHSKILGSGTNTLHHLLKDILSCFPVKRTDLRYYLMQRGAEIDDSYLCIKIKALSKDSNISTEYICSTIEGAFGFCIAFEHESVIAVFINLTRTSKVVVEEMAKTLENLIATLQLKAGISYPFTDLCKAYYYYRQACCAFEIGSSMNPDKMIYNFSDYSLDYVLSKCFGEFSSEILYPPEILKLIDHDKHSGISYFETLKTYLDNNQNLAHTSLVLSIHRSTLLTRIKNIKDILGNDLSDPDYRLFIQILLRTCEK